MRTSMKKRSWFLPLVAMSATLGGFVACGSNGSDNASSFGQGGGDAAIGFVNPGDFGDAAGTTITTGDGGTCAASSKAADVSQLDLVLLVDSSGSMNANSKWQSLTKALQSFFNDDRAAGIGVSLQYFPRFAGSYPVCDESVYAIPEVDLTPLDSTQAGILVNSLLNRSPLGGTPMGPALQGALRFATTWQKQNSTHKVVTVLATDGLPDESCQFAPAGRAENTIDGVKAQAAAALAANPSVPTYVIGVGTELGALDAVAVSGGTEHTVIVDVQKDVSAQLFEAFDKIRRTELTCEYTLPIADSSGSVDLDKVNVRFTDALGYVDFLYVENAANCKKTDYGWYFDDIANPQRVVLCSPFCDEVKASRLGKVDILLGCKRQEIIR